MSGRSRRAISVVSGRGVWGVELDGRAVEPAVLKRVFGGVAGLVRRGTAADAHLQFDTDIVADVIDGGLILAGESSGQVAITLSPPTKNDSAPWASRMCSISEA